MADATYIPKVYHAQGSDEVVVADGGKITVESGGAIEVLSGTGTCSTNAVTINALSGKITTEALTTAAGAAVTLTITNDQVVATDIILLTRQGGTSDEGTEIMLATAGAGSFTILIENRHASAAFDGTFIIGFYVVKVAV